MIAEREVLAHAMGGWKPGDHASRIGVFLASCSLICHLNLRAFRVWTNVFVPYRVNCYPEVASGYLLQASGAKNNKMAMRTR